MMNCRLGKETLGDIILIDLREAPIRVAVGALDGLGTLDGCGTAGSHIRHMGRGEGPTYQDDFHNT